MDFDEWFKAYGNLQCDKDACEDSFEAGQQSKQEEVNKLQAQLDKLQSEIDALQYHIDTALWYLEDYDDLAYIIRILKGEQK